MNNIRLMIVPVMLMFSTVAWPSATGCTSDRSLPELARAASLIVYGTLTGVRDAGYELVDGSVSTTAPVLGTTYLGNVKHVRVKVREVIKGAAGPRLDAYLSLPILNLGGCPERLLAPRQSAVILLSQRPNGYWVVEGRDGLILTDEQGLDAVVMQFTEPTVVAP